MSKSIEIRGAREHNLKSVDVTLPRDQLIVITGLSGSGKSSLAFDTIYAEGQRRYVESLSVAARQFLAQLPKPDADLIEGLSPAVAIAQVSPARNPRSTVGTMTEILDFLRLLFARTGIAISPATGEAMRRHSIEDMVDGTLSLPNDTRFSVLAPVAIAAAGDQAELLEDLRRRGFVRVLVDEQVHDLSEPLSLDAERRHDIAVYVDRLKMKDGLRARLADSIETAVELSGGVVEILPLEGETLRFSQHFADLEHGVTFPEVTPSLLSFNSPHGACPRCDGLGVVQTLDPRALVDEGAGLGNGAIFPWKKYARLNDRLAAVAKHFSVDVLTPWSELAEEIKIVVLEGAGTETIDGKIFEGVMPWLRRRLSERATKKGTSDNEESAGTDDLTQYATDTECDACQGARLRPEALMIRVGDKNVAELSAMPLSQLRTFIAELSLPGSAGEVADAIVGQVRQRLAFLEEVGLGYLTLQRRAMTLSGGEAQRIRLATQIGAALVGVTYVLDEPSIGLHQRDNARLIRTLMRLRDLGNTLIVVEHDAETMLASDWLVDMGPGAGDYGGTVVAAGPVDEVLAHERSLTGAYLSGRMQIEQPAQRRSPTLGSITIRGATGHNLKNVTARIPIGVLSCVTGVSGSGKSSLIIDTLLPEAKRQVAGGTRVGLPHRRLEGLSQVDRVIHVDQSAIGRSGRSNPATYTGMLSEVRTVFAQLPEAKIRGWGAARFSFNVKGGRCEVCGGEGQRRIEMHFLPDLYVECSSCQGRRYNRETLAVTMRGKTIADVLQMSVAQAHDFFVAHPAIRAKLEVLRDVGLGYVTLGQSALTLSGGEAQRIKLAKELSKRSTGRTLFILDEPTTGLHVSDVRQLLAVLQRLVDEGNTVVVIEHDLDVIKVADHIIDLGPEGGDGGGTVVVAGTPEQVAACPASHTGRYLADVLG